MDRPDEATVARLMHEHDLTDMPGGGVVKHSHRGGDSDHGHDFASGAGPHLQGPIAVYPAE